MCSVDRNTLVLSLVVVALAGFLGTAAADTEANKASYRRVNQEAWSQGQLAVVDECVAAGYVYHEPALGEVHGPEGLKQTIMAYRTAYPDLQFTIEDLIAEGDLVALRWSAAGTQKGELMGIPATGLATTTVGINLARFDADGKIVEEWCSWDVLGLMQQLGVAAPPRPGPEFYLWDAPSDITGDAGDPVTNKLLVLRVKSQFWNGKDIAGLDETHHANALGHDVSFPAQPGYDSYRQGCLAYQMAFPDLHHTTDTILAEGDKVVVRWTGTGTQQGELIGIPASGKPVKFTGITIYRIADGKIAESWWAYDAFGLVQQITSPPEYSPVGTWLVSSPTPAGNILLLHSIHPEDDSGMSFGGFCKQVNNNPTFFGMIPEGEGGVDIWASKTRRTGPNTYQTTLLYYVTKQGQGPLEETVAIGVVDCHWTITGPDTNEGQATISIYLAAQDADADGLPDEGQEPTICAPFVVTSRRMGHMPGCVPEPMPEVPTP
ncbi:MAG: ester cyclase [Sedimentisphaerales bacterium]|nr:ester cyclase [Sedimentisphaerales bacterium]